MIEPIKNAMAATSVIPVAQGYPQRSCRDVADGVLAVASLYGYLLIFNFQISILNASR
jgi:hypothetical protein